MILRITVTRNAKYLSSSAEITRVQIAIVWKVSCWWDLVCRRCHFGPLSLEGNASESKQRFRYTDEEYIFGVNYSKRGGFVPRYEVLYFGISPYIFQKVCERKMSTVATNV